MLNTPFSPWPSFTQEEADAVSRVLLSNKVNYWTGSECREFEKEFAAWADSDYAIALANGTLALDLALKVLGIGAGDEVVVTSRTFLASASSVVTAGAVPVFADVDADSQNITVETIRAVLTPRTRAIVCVHLAGWPCDMDPIMALAEENGLYVIEDCAQAHGARYKGRSVGSIGHFGAWSFCQDKIMTTGGEGGMLTTNRHDWWDKAWSYKDHGKSWDAVYKRQHPPGFRWLHESFGTNWRMTELQGVIGRIQLARMTDWHARRSANALRLARSVAALPALRMPLPAVDCEHAWYKFYAFVRPEALRPGWDRDRIMAEINAAGVPCFSGSCSEVYLEKAFDNTGWRPVSRLPVAKALGETSLMFLVHPTLSEAEIEKTSSVLEAVMAQAADGEIR
ncbi:MAG: aminotransferase [Proteobacteria bacterium]|nr:aminotransferase [Pseudomonadota bacterium]